MEKESLFKRFFIPPSKLMGRLNYPQKFIVIFCFFMIPIALAFYFFLFEIKTSVDFTAKEKIGLEIIKNVSIFMQDVQKRRGMYSAFLNGDNSFAEIIAEKEKEIDKDIKSTQETISKFEKEMPLKEEWDKLVGEFENLKSRKDRLSSEESFYAHSDVIGKIILFERRIGDVSNLILDPKSETYHMIDSVINLFSNLGENLGQLRAFGLSIPVNKELTREEKRFINRLINSIRSVAVSLNPEKNSMFITLSGDEKKLLEASMLANKISIENMADSLEESLVNKGVMSISYGEYYSITTKVLDNLFLFSGNIVPVIDHLLNDRIDGEILKRNYVLAVGLMALLLAMYMLAGFYVSVKKTLKELEGVADNLVKNKTGWRVKLSTKDELSKIGDLFGNVGLSLINANNLLIENAAKREEVENKLKARTEELEKINDFMIGREIKMAELKKEIKELKTNGIVEKQS